MYRSDNIRSLSLEEARDTIRQALAPRVRWPTYEQYCAAEHRAFWNPMSPQMRRSLREIGVKVGRYD